MRRPVIAVQGVELTPVINRYARSKSPMVARERPRWQWIGYAFLTRGRLLGRLEGLRVGRTREAGWRGFKIFKVTRSYAVYKCIATLVAGSPIQC